MSSEEKRQNRPGEEDSWESLAEDLFGIDFGKAAARNEPPANDDFPPDESDSSSSADSDEAAEADETIGVVDSQEEPAAVEETVATPASSETAPQPEKRDDSYWDALSDWEWDNTGSANGEPDAGRKAGASPPRRSSPAKPPVDEARKPPTPAANRRDVSPAPVNRDEYVADDDFGLGVLNEAQETRVPPEAESPLDVPETVETSANEAGDDEQDQGATAALDDAEEAPAHKRKKRRRRRRRPRGTGHVDETDDAAPSDSEPLSDSEPFEETPPTEKVDATAADAGDPLDVDEEEPPQEVDRDVPSVHRELPTWEEAVSYLINPAQTEARSQESSSGTQGKRARSKSDSSKSPSRRGRRGRR